MSRIFVIKIDTENWAFKRPHILPGPHWFVGYLYWKTVAATAFYYAGGGDYVYYVIHDVFLPWVLDIKYVADAVGVLRRKMRKMRILHKRCQSLYHYTHRGRYEYIYIYIYIYICLSESVKYTSIGSEGKSNHPWRIACLASSHHWTNACYC